jgi:battenin
MSFRDDANNQEGENDRLDLSQGNLDPLHEPDVFIAPGDEPDGLLGTNASSERMSLLICLAFGGAGLLNNCPYVIMLATAKYISEGGVAAVYLANILPGLAVQITAPYWFDRVSYRVRLLGAALSMLLAFLMTAFFSSTSGVFSPSVVLAGQLWGVALISLQCGLGEASLLALAGKCDSRPQQPITLEARPNSSAHKGHCLSAFATGTGAAGPLGYLWKVAWTEWLGLSVPASLFLAALVLSVSYGVLGHLLVLWSLESSHYPHQEYTRLPDTTLVQGGNSMNGNERMEDANGLPPCIGDEPLEEIANNLTCQDSSLPSLTDLNFSERFHLLRRLCWPYMIPLFTVYAAEYACQSGAWTAIGFPVTSTESRAQFYEQSNWLYQAGVFVSRSSGSVVSVNMVVLWVMPALQVVNLILFSITARTGVPQPHGFLYRRPALLGLSFFTGILGGAVYVHGFQRMVADIPKPYTEFAVSSTAVAESLGVLVADVAGLFLQSCLYQANHLDGELVKCPF